jgi:hypothetical protein
MVKNDLMKIDIKGNREELLDGIRGSTGDGKVDHPIVDQQRSSLDNTLYQLRCKIISGAQFIQDGLTELTDAVQRGTVPYTTTYTDRMIKLERLLIRYGELSEIARSIKIGIEMEQKRNKQSSNQSRMKQVFSDPDLLTEKDLDRNENKFIEAIKDNDG